MRTLLLALCLLLPLAPAHAQSRLYSQPELDALLAPIALYPDALLSEVLQASQFPGQVGDAARGAQDPSWDPNVQALLAYPELLSRMAENPQWMLDLGSAYMSQTAQVVATVQSLRQRAQANGALQSDDQYRVIQ